MESGLHQLRAQLEILESSVSRLEIAVDGARKACLTAKSTCQRAAALRREACGMRIAFGFSQRDLTPNGPQRQTAGTKRTEAARHDAVLNLDTPKAAR